jgi:hypothetical protein
VEDQYNSHLDLLQFCTVDNSLTGTAGMKRIINTYRATNGTEKLAIGAGNSKSIDVSYTPKEYDIALAQNRFTWNDEHAMTDPMLVPTGMKHAGTDMFNTVQADIYGEFAKTGIEVSAATPNFDAFVDAGAALNLENLEGVYKFALVCPDDVGKIRKALKGDLIYVSEYAKNGYIGSVADVHIHTKADATANEIIVATKDAVTVFNKTGVEVEQDRDSNTRTNNAYSRKYYVVALTDESKAVKIKLTA